jgi:hypothetical protein
MEKIQLLKCEIFLFFVLFRLYFEFQTTNSNNANPSLFESGNPRNPTKEVACLKRGVVRWPTAVHQLEQAAVQLLPLHQLLRVHAACQYLPYKVKKINKQTKLGK